MRRGEVGWRECPPLGLQIGGLFGDDHFGRLEPVDVAGEARAKSPVLRLGGLRLVSDDLALDAGAPVEVVTVADQRHQVPEVVEVLEEVAAGNELKKDARDRLQGEAQEGDDEQQLKYSKCGCAPNSGNASKYVVGLMDSV